MFSVGGAKKQAYRSAASSTGSVSYHVRKKGQIQSVSCVIKRDKLRITEDAPNHQGRRRLGRRPKTTPPPPKPAQGRATSKSTNNHQSVAASKKNMPCKDGRSCHGTSTASEHENPGSPSSCQKDNQIFSLAGDQNYRKRAQDTRCTETTDQTAKEE